MAFRFRQGDYVEVTSDEDGFQGAYYTAKVVKPLSQNQYLVQYQTLLTDDESSMLREVVDAIHVRPLPPVIRALEFRAWDEVDVYANDGWWVGRVVGEKEGMYEVFFDCYECSIWYGVDELRIHQEWEYGRWVISDYHKCTRLV
ncbi:hypothetical protein Scep_011617 [Stephania cephalantha]|uniref:Agenet domain-containing protein n=1 Tax=Stephania cephalantha TaxID=152367 RepID=A0AAP0JDN2_9MAGN